MRTQNSEDYRNLEREVKDGKPVVVCVFGKRGYGKTTLAKDIIRLHRRVFIFDPLAEYADVSISVPSFCAESMPIAQHHFRYSYTTDNDDIFEIVAEAVYNTHNLLFVVEEVDYFCSANFTSPHFKRIIRYGRHRGISILGVSRRPADVSRLLTSQSNYIISFRQTEPRDLDYLERYGFTRHELMHLSVGQSIIRRI